MLIENLANELQCSICLSLFSIPFVIPCGHTFCRDCIQNYGKTSKASKCPLCKQPFNLSKINLNISLQAVLNIMDQDNTKVKGDVSRKKSKSTNFFICTSNLSDEYKVLQMQKKKFTFFCFKIYKQFVQFKLTSILIDFQLIFALNLPKQFY